MDYSKYPIPVFHYKVTWNNLDVGGFSEVSGLTQEIQAIEYRDGTMGYAAFPLKRPGLKKANNISLKRGIVKANNGFNGFFDWFNNYAKKDQHVDRGELAIALCNDEGDTVMTWHISQAWPVKCEGPGLKASGNEIAIETLEFTHEGIGVTTP